MNTSAAVIVSVQPSGERSTRQPAASTVSKRPDNSRSAIRKRMSSPMPAARAIQSARTAANPAPPFHCASRPIILKESGPISMAGDAGMPAAARSIAGYSVSAGWEAQLMPIPIATAPSPPLSVSTRIPASFARSSNRSFGHFIATRASRPTAISTTASWTASAATSDSCGRHAGNVGLVSSRLANRLPGCDIHARPRRPRPAVCRPATIQSGPHSPRRARLSASLLVEPSTLWVTRRTPAAAALGSSAIIAENSEQRPRRGIRGVDQRCRIDKEQQIEQAGDRKHGAELTRHRLQRSRRLVKIHDLHDREIVVGPHDAGDDADNGEGEKTSLDRGEEYVELGEESGERRNAREREQEQREEKRHRRLAARTACEIADLLHHMSVPAHGENAGEGSKRHGEIDRNVHEHALHAFGRSRGEPDQRKSHMTDRGVRHQPLDIALANGRE